MRRKAVWTTGALASVVAASCCGGTAKAATITQAAEARVSGGVTVPGWGARRS